MPSWKLRDETFFFGEKERRKEAKGNIFPSLYKIEKFYDICSAEVGRVKIKFSRITAQLEGI